jgi:NADH:ubiquinone oxidoreductase subunit 6 (subunit J)
MEEKSASIWKTALTTGLYLAIALILISVIFYVTGNPFSKVGQYLSYPIMIGGIILAQIMYKKALGDTLTYGQAVGVGVLAMVFASVISGMYTYLLYTIIDPSLQEQMRIFTEEQIAKKGIPEEQLEMAVKMAAKFQSPPILFA